jgi:hypothetical protein
MAAGAVVEGLQRAEGRQSRLVMSAPGAPIGQLGFRRTEEARTERVSVGIADAAHAELNAGRTAAGAESQAGVLAAVVGMMDQAGG